LVAPTASVESHGTVEIDKLMAHGLEAASNWGATGLASATENITKTFYNMSKMAKKQAQQKALA
jgi:hypothetical protein